MARVITFILHTNLPKLNKFCLKYETFQERRLLVAQQVTMAGLSKRNLTHSRTFIKDICTGTIIFVTSMRFPLWLTGIAACSQANQPMIQKLQETCCVKITSYTTFLGIASLSFPRSNFYTHCHLKILGLTKNAVLKVKLSGCRYIFGH